jgi:hypothetical protein
MRVVMTVLLRVRWSVVPSQRSAVGRRYVVAQFADTTDDPLSRGRSLHAQNTSGEIERGFVHAVELGDAGLYRARAVSAIHAGDLKALFTHLLTQKL